jgi:AcrR family transcriptional regulator
MGPKPALSIERIADKAVEIADREGFQAVSMQRVASEFDYTKMALYRYIAGKGELVAAMIDRAVEEPPVLDGAATGWRPGIEEWARLLAEVWQRHPWLPAVTVGDRLMGPNEVAWIECAIAIFASSGLAPEEQMDAVLMLSGHIRNTQSAATAGTQPWTASRQRALLRDHGERYPALTRLLADADRAPSDQGRGFGLQCILDGLEARIETRQSARPLRKR